MRLSSIELIMNKLSVVLATHNEEKHIGECLEAVKDIADEIIVVDGTSTDRTREIAEKHGARVIKKDNPKIFHINKQVALEGAKNEWILQLDADERVTVELAKEITKITSMSKGEIEEHQENLKEKDLFQKHQRLVEDRDGKIGTSDGDFNAFFVPRLNYFLGKYLKYGGVYPDGVIRLVKKGYAEFPCKSVHEQIEVSGRVGWLANPLYHMADTTFPHYLKRNSNYIDLLKDELVRDKVGKNLYQFVSYMFVKPIHWFFLTQIRHKGILDGYQGIVFSFFSALRFPRAYWRYLRT
jgi:glycosyltransferase involved in cell wall biosynthesis